MNALLHITGHALISVKVATHIRRIEAVEADLKTLSASAATKEETSKVRAELKKAYDGLHLEFLDLKAHVWGIRTFPFYYFLVCLNLASEQDLHALSGANGHPGTSSAKSS